MKVALLSAMLLIFLPAAARSEGKTDWDAEWRNLCSYDGRFCNSVRTDNGGWVKARPEILKVFEIMRPKLMEYAKKFGVDPRAVVGAVLAENSMNVTRTDDFQDLLVRMKIAPQGNLFGFAKKFSFGWGQLYMEAAMAGEKTAAKLEKRPMRTSQEVEELLLTPAGSIYYVAATLRELQDTYAEQGMDISGKPEILATLYNLGKGKERALEAKSKQAAPRENYFGFFVRKNLPLIEAVTAPKAVAALPSRPAPDNYAGPWVTASSSALALTSSPPICTKDGRGREADYSQIGTKRTYPSVGKVPANAQYEVVSTGLDCDLNAWSLIRDEYDLTGWVSDAELEKSSYRRPATMSTCPKKANASCVSSVTGIAGDPLTTSEDGLMELGILGPKPKKDYRQPSISCGSYSGSQQQKPPADVLDADQIKALLKVIDEQKAKVVSELKLRSWEDSANPYRITSLDNLKNSLGYCSAPPSLGSSYSQKCIVPNPTALTAALNFKITAAPGLKDIIRINAAIDPLMTSTSVNNVVLTDPTENEKIRGEVLRKISTCLPLVKNLTQSEDYLKQILDWYKTADTNNYYFGDLTNKADSFLINCAKWGEILQVPMPKPTSTPSSSLEPTSSCDIPIWDSKSNYARSMSSTVEMVRKLTKTSEEKDEYVFAGLRSAFSPSNLSSATSYSSDRDSTRCSYDPFATADLIEELLKEAPCIKQVYVPDPWLLQRLSKHKSRVVYRPFFEVDRFAVDISKYDCSSSQEKKK
jgi:hypothetical protein